MTALSPSAFLCTATSSVLCVTVVSNNCATLAPSASCQIQLRYQGEAGEFSQPGVLQFPITPSSSTTATTYNLPFTQVVPAPITPSTGISVSPSVLQFPATAFGQDSAPLTVTVTNNSQMDLGLNAASIPDFIVDPSCGPLLPGKSCNLSVRFVPSSGVPNASGAVVINAFDASSAAPAITGANPADFSMSGSCTSIPANSSCQLSVSFNPSATGTRMASLSIGTGSTVDPNNGQLITTSTTVTLSGIGVAIGPGAEVHPRRLHFRRREVGSISEARRIILTNPGNTALALPAPALTGANPLDFRLSGSCNSIAAGARCELHVQFSPTAEGNRSATLVIPTGGSANVTVPVVLTGTGCISDVRDEDRHRRDEDCDRGRDEEQGDR